MSVVDYTNGRQILTVPARGFVESRRAGDHDLRKGQRYFQGFFKSDQPSKFGLFRESSTGPSQVGYLDPSTEDADQVEPAGSMRDFFYLITAPRTYFRIENDSDVEATIEVEGWLRCNL